MFIVLVKQNAVKFMLKINYTNAVFISVKSHIQTSLVIFSHQCLKLPLTSKKNFYFSFLKMFFPRNTFNQWPYNKFNFYKETKILPSSTQVLIREKKNNIYHFFTAMFKQQQQNIKNLFICIISHNEKLKGKLKLFKFLLPIINN